MAARDVSLRYAIENRKSTRRFIGGTLPCSDYQDLIWAACGYTHSYKDIRMRTAPSAGATYPVDILTAVENIEGLENGIYSFDRAVGGFGLTRSGSFLGQVRQASYDQKFITRANTLIFMVYNPSLIVPHYGESAFKYAAFECGHIAQNVILMATSLGLGSVPVGAFDQSGVDAILGISGGRTTLYFVAVGRIK